MKLLGIAGYSGAGKTTLIEALLPRLSAAGMLVSVIKQSHHTIDLDHPGKDTWRHRQAGAQEVILATPQRWMLVHELRSEPQPDAAELAQRLAPCDLVLVEGYRHADLPKLEVWRAANACPWLHPQDAHVLALAADRQPAATLPYFHLDDVDGIAAFILNWSRQP